MNLSEMITDVQCVCKDKGWYDTPVTFLESMALLHTEIVEMDDAWQSHGMRPFVSEEGGPDGVATELADVLIRSLDNAGRYELNIEPLHYEFITRDGVPGRIRELHKLVVNSTEAFRKNGIEGVSEPISVLIGAVQSFAFTFCLDLPAAYEEKMAYNRKRAYRHGGKRA